LLATPGGQGEPGDCHREVREHQPPDASRGTSPTPTFTVDDTSTKRHLKVVIPSTREHPARQRCAGRCWRRR
jgi:hypothetical protein